MATARAVATIPSHITMVPGVCGGKACIDGTRIRVLDIVGLHKQGLKPEQMLHVYAVPLTLGQVHAALAYYYDHREEIEAQAKEGRRLVAKIQRDQARFLRQRRQAR